MNWLLGVDGGGTKTELILVDAAGNVRQQITAPGCNPNLSGAAQAEAILQRALATILERASVRAESVGLLLLCMAGSRSFWRDFASRSRGWKRVLAMDDSHPVLELATSGEAGLALHAGTGSFVAARDAENRIHYAGGLGWRLGDPASSYDLGRRGFARGLLELQGWMEPSPMGKALVAYTGQCIAGEITRELYAAPDTGVRVTGFAPKVMELASQGEVAAAEILIEAVATLVDLASSVTSRTFSGQTAIRCGLSGPILRQPVALAAMETVLRKRALPWQCFPIAESPIEGVRRLLVRFNGLAAPHA